jgi:D-beta-D-heptose 7-phosphate kinase/D-beta-D-heptose 1-phosphate adenosyltransferase
MHNDLAKIAAELGSPSILVVGDFMLDVYIYGDAERISPEAPVPVLKVTKTPQYRCGGAGSVAVDLAALGAVPYCLGVVGGHEKDQNAQILRDKLTSAGANVDGLLPIPGRRTTSKHRLIGLAQHRHRQQLMRIDYETTEPLSAAQYEELLQIYDDLLPEMDIVCLQDYNKGLLIEPFCLQIIQAARRAGKQVLVDPAPITDYSKYAGATAITPNRREASMATGIDVVDEQSTAAAADMLAGNLSLEAVIITLDKDGAYLKTNDISQPIPTKPRTVYDVTGAGDMVLAVLAVTLACGCDYTTAVQLANVAGGLEVQKFGAATVTREEIINEIRGKAGKLHSLDSLVKELARHRKLKHKTVFTNGCFDVVHRGHIEYLSFCKAHGDIVVVGLNSDSSVKVIKGPERPINDQYDRAAVLEGLESVDYIVIFDEPTPLNLITQVKPDILVKGQDWADKGVIGREFVESYGGQVLLAPLVDGKSSTSTIEKIRLLHAKP